MHPESYLPVKCYLQEEDPPEDHDVRRFSAVCGRCYEALDSVHKAEICRLQHLCRLQQEQIETLNGFADSVEALRDIGKVIGCGHVDDPDGRRQLVNCVEQEFSRLREKVHDLTAESLVAGIAKKPEILTKLAERLQSNEIVD